MQAHIDKINKYFENGCPLCQGQFYFPTNMLASISCSHFTITYWPTSYKPLLRIVIKHLTNYVMFSINQDELEIFTFYDTAGVYHDVNPKINPEIAFSILKKILELPKKYLENLDLIIQEYHKFIVIAT